MKHGKAPTKAQKIILKSYGLNSDNWLIVKNTDKEMMITNRFTGRIRKIPKRREI